MGLSLGALQTILDAQSHHARLAWPRRACALAVYHFSPPYSHTQRSIVGVVSFGKNSATPPPRGVAALKRGRVRGCVGGRGVVCACGGGRLLGREKLLHRDLQGVCVTD
jgi:hypothetical protein